MCRPRTGFGRGLREGHTWASGLDLAADSARWVGKQPRLCTQTKSQTSCGLRFPTGRCVMLWFVLGSTFFTAIEELCCILGSASGTPLLLFWAGYCRSQTPSPAPTPPPQYLPGSGAAASGPATSFADLEVLSIR
jgi:hypothetical protein